MPFKGLITLLQTNKELPILMCGDSYKMSSSYRKKTLSVTNVSSGRRGRITKLPSLERIFPPKIINLTLDMVFEKQTTSAACICFHGGSIYLRFSYKIYTQMSEFLNTFGVAYG